MISMKMINCYILILIVYTQYPYIKLFLLQMETIVDKHVQVLTKISNTYKLTRNNK